MLTLKLVITRKNLFPFAPVVRLVIFNERKLVLGPAHVKVKVKVKVKVRIKKL